MNLLNSMTNYIFLSLINMIKSKRLFQVRVIHSVSNKDNQKEGAWKDNMATLQTWKKQNKKKTNKTKQNKTKVITNF